MAGGEAREAGWRRSRAPAPRPLSSAQFWLFAAFFLGVAFLAGLGTVVTEGQWWARACGGVVSLTVVAASVWLVAYFRRPVDRDARDARDAANNTAAAASLRASLERHGCVEVPLGRGAVAKTLAQVLGGVLICVASSFFVGDPVGVALCMAGLGAFVFLAVLPHVEFLTAARPALRVDGVGIRIARWTPLTVPWTEVVSVRVHQSTRTQSHVVIQVSDAFFKGYLAARPPVLALSDRVLAAFAGRSFTIPSTIVATAESLAALLDGEVERRQRAIAPPPEC